MTNNRDWLKKRPWSTHTSTPWWRSSPSLVQIMLCVPAVSRQPDEDWQMMASQRKLNFPAHLSVHMYFNAHLWIKNILFTTITKGGKLVFRERGGKKKGCNIRIYSGRTNWMEGKESSSLPPFTSFYPHEKQFLSIRVIYIFEIW